MKFVKIDLEDTYPEQIEGTSEWYCSKIGNNFCDLYETEEIIRNGHVYEGMNCVLIHFPDGQVFRPFETKENVYVESPVYWDGTLYFLVVDFVDRTIQIVSFDTENYEKNIVAELSLDEVKDCYNLMLRIAPVMLVRDANENCLEVIWPEKKTFQMEEHESLCYRDGDKMYFSEWWEDPEYHERMIVRDWKPGEELERFNGAVCRMPNGDIWRL